MMRLTHIGYGGSWTIIQTSNSCWDDHEWGSVEICSPFPHFFVRCNKCGSILETSFSDSEKAEALERFKLSGREIA